MDGPGEYCYFDEKANLWMLFSELEISCTSKKPIIQQYPYEVNPN
jgi:hypothetical protein